MHTLQQTYPGARMEGDYSLIRVLIELEVTYKIAITDKNREQINAVKKNEHKTDIKFASAVVGTGSKKGSKTNSKTTSKVNSR